MQQTEHIARREVKKILQGIFFSIEIVYIYKSKTLELIQSKPYDK
jgi:hypothetical protein